MIHETLSAVGVPPARLLVVPEHAIDRSRERVASRPVWAGKTNEQIVTLFNEWATIGMAKAEQWWEDTSDRGVVLNYVLDLDPFLPSAQACMVMRKLEEKSRYGEEYILVTVLTAQMKRRHIAIRKWANTPDRIDKKMQRPSHMSMKLDINTAAIRDSITEEMVVVSWPDGDSRRYRELARSALNAFLSGLIGPHVRQEDVRIYKRVDAKINVSVEVEM